MTDIVQSVEDAPYSDSFGIYRAEWLSNLFELFTKPAYYPELETARPCVLSGGRGTGKTTVLKCLSYEGRYALSKYDDDSVSEWPYYGFYSRINTNRVTAFKGEELSEVVWRKLFAHYLNLSMCGQVVDFLNWYASKAPSAAMLDTETCRDISEMLHLDSTEDQASLGRAIKTGQRRFEGYLNNLEPDALPRLSLQGQPVDELCEAILKLSAFQGKSLFFIVDEYENLLDYQQEILNTLIKHCGLHYTFKIGVKEMGWRIKHTLNENEQLVSPADYEKIDIEQRLDGEPFVQFAAEVCRLRARDLPGFPLGGDIAAVLPSISIEEEARKLGVDEHVARIRENVDREAPQWSDDARSMAPLDLYLVDFWTRSQKLSLDDAFSERQAYPLRWADRLNNYKVPLLFTLRAKKPGLRKLYAGWRTYTSMAGNNIRYILELVGQALQLHGQEGGEVGKPVAPELQTRAAIMVGRKNLAELEGLSVHGAQLTKLLLGLGRVFEVLASQPEGHTPELTQFTFTENPPLGEAKPLVMAAVMHLVLVRSVANKRSDLDLKAYDYAVHPIYSAFFNFSHRRKRKLRVSPTQLLALVKEPRSGVRQILRAQNRMDEDYPLPEQLALFEGHYNGPQ